MCTAVRNIKNNIIIIIIGRATIQVINYTTILTWSVTQQ